MIKSTDDTLLKLKARTKQNSQIILLAEVAQSIVELKIEANSQSPQALFLHAATRPTVKLISSTGKEERLDAAATHIFSVWKISIPPSQKARNIISVAHDKEKISVLRSSGLELIEIPYAQREFSVEVLIEKAAICLLVTCLVLLFVVYSSAFEPLQNRFAFLSTTLAATLTVFGVALSGQRIWDIAAIIKEFMGNRLFGGSVAALLAVSVWFLAQPMQCIFKSYRFEVSLRKATSPGNLSARYFAARQALTQFPNRIEPYYVISRLAEDDGKVIDLVTNDTTLANSVAKFLSVDAERPCHCTNQSEGEVRHLQRQVLSWAYIKFDFEGDFVQSIEAELPTSFTSQQHYELVKSIVDFEKLDYMSLVSSGSTKEERRAEIDKISGEFSEIGENYSKIFLHLFGDPDVPGDWGLRAEYPNDFLIQASLDRQISHNIRICDFEKVRIYGSDFITFRQRYLDGDSFWIHSPRSLELFHFFRLLRSSEEKLRAFRNIPAYDLGSIVATCRNWENQEKAKSVEFFRANFPEWWKQSEDKWFEASIAGLDWSELQDVILSRSVADWNY